MSSFDREKAREHARACLRENPALTWPHYLLDACERIRQLDEALQMLASVHPDKVGDWEIAADAEQAERMMREFARDVIEGERA